jgi:hypothetical protein
MFHPECMSTCSGCGHVITASDGNEDVPRIVPSKKRGRLTLVLFCVGLPALFFYPIGTFLGVSALFAALVAADDPTRCGNCGAALKKNRAGHCHACSARLTTDVL